MTMRLELLSQDRKTIPIHYSRGRLHTTDVRPPDVLLTNASSRTPEILCAEIRCLGGGQELAIYRLPWPRLQEGAREALDRLQELGRTTCGRARIGMRCGRLAIPLEALSQEPSPGASVVLPFHDLLPIVYTGPDRPEALEIRVAFMDAGIPASAGLVIPLVEYRCKGHYTFPLRSPGRLYHATNPVANAMGHRRCRAEEFAIDMVAARQDPSRGCLTIRSAPTALPEDHLVFGEDVRSIGDGVVQDVVDAFPDAPLLSDEAKERMIEDLSSTIGGKAAIDGNHIVIDHGNGEFSQYCHLMHGSIRIHHGESIQRGQAIAKVGNTGNSSAPHLHLQLMDGPDELTANGLPILFQDIQAEEINDEIGTHCNTLMFSPYLYFTLEG